jgi:hypothetical protein
MSEPKLSCATIPTLLSHYFPIEYLALSSLAGGSNPLEPLQKTDPAYAWHVVKVGHVPQDRIGSESSRGLNAVPAEPLAAVTADIKTILFYGIDANDQGKKYVNRTAILDFLNSNEGGALREEILGYLTHLDRASTRLSRVDDIENQLEEFAKRITRETAKKKIIALVETQLGAEAVNLVISYLETLESLTSVPPGGSTSRHQGCIRNLSQAQIDQIMDRAKERPWRFRAKRNMCPWTFLRETYGEWLEEGLSMSILRRADRDLYQRLHNWRRKPGNKLPPGILPTRNEILTQEVALASASPAAIPEVRRIQISGRLIRRKLRAITAT